VNPGSFEDLLITFTPDSIQTETAIINFSHNDPVTTIPEISLTGTGINPVNSNDILPLVTEVFQNYPNPFNPETTIKYSLVEAANVSIIIYNIKGEKVRSLVQQFQEPQFYQEVWNGKDDANKPVASGVYFYVTRIGDYKSFNKMLLIK